MYICNKCEVEKDLNCFYKGRKICKECVLKSKKERYETEKEHMLSINKKWFDEKGSDKAKKHYHENKEKYAERWKNYYHENKDNLNERHRLYYHENKEEVAKRWKNYYNENLQWHINRMTEYRKSKQGKKTITAYKQSEKGKQSNKQDKHKRRSKERETLSSLSLEQWKECLVHFKNSCCYCGEHTDKITQDHFVPVSKGGEYTIKNIVPSCGSCNFSKGNRPFKEWYPKRKTYSIIRENKVLKYLGYKEGKQQTVLF